MRKTHQDKFEFGIYTFGEIIPDPVTGKVISAEERIKNIIETAKLADEAGLDIFGLGEHHRLDFAVSSTPVVLAAIANATKNDFRWTCGNHCRQRSIYRIVPAFWL
jgi:predicted amino acid dehydrogenase